MLLRVIAVLLIAHGIALGALVGWTLPLGEALFRHDPALLNTAQAAVQRYVWPDLWDHAALPVLEHPSWVLPAALGVLLLALRGLFAPSRRRWR